MKKELIKTPEYLLVVDDSEIKEGDYGFITSAVMSYDAMIKEWNQPLGSKIIAHLPLNNSPILEGVPLLPPFEVEDDVEKLAEDLFDKGSDNLLHPQYQMRTFFNIGYNKAREKYKFTEEDMRKAIRLATTSKHDYTLVFFSEKEIIQSLSQPKMPTHFECKTFDTGNDELDGTHILEIRTTTNSQGQEVVCGKYIY